jgi:hypothetical protein
VTTKQIEPDEPWHLRFVAGHQTPQAVKDFLEGHDDMTPEQAAQLAEVHKLLVDGKRTGATNATPEAANQTAGGGVPIAWVVRQFHEVDQADAKIAAIVSALPNDGADFDPAALAAAIAAHLNTNQAAAVGGELTKPSRQ